MAEDNSIGKRRDESRPRKSNRKSEPENPFTLRLGGNTNSTVLRNLVVKACQTIGRGRQL